MRAMAHEAPSGPVAASRRRRVIDGYTVTFDDSADHRLWHCACADFERRFKQFGEGFCAHTAVAMMNQTFPNELEHGADRE